MRLYDLLLHCYPAGYRSEYGDEMRRAFEQRLIDEPPRLGSLGRTVAALGDVLPNAAAIQAEYVGSDLRRVGRMFRGTPFVLGSGVGVLAIGVGANAAVFGVLNTILVKPLPYRDSNRVVMIWRMPSAPVPRGLTAGVGSQTVVRVDNRRIMTATEVRSLRQDTSGALSDVAAINLWQGNLEAQFDLPLAERVERLRGALVTPNFFHLLGVRPALGHLFDSSDDGASTTTPLVLSNALWQREFGGDPRVLGRTVTMVAGPNPRTPRTFVIVGVLQPDFRFTYPEETEAWAALPWSAIPSGGRQGLVYRAAGRLAPGVTLKQAKARLAALVSPNEPMPRSTLAVPPSLWPDPIADWVAADVRPELYLLGGVALLMLLVTCATVANVIFVRAAARNTEFAVRSALGANRRQLLRQLLVEGAAVAALGAALGILVAVVAGPVVHSLIPDTMPRRDDFSMNASLLLCTGAVAVVTTMLAALAPLQRATRVDLIAGLSGRSFSTPGGGTGWLSRQRILGAQAAMATTLLIFAALLMTSFWRLRHVPLGFDGERVLTVEMRLLDPKYRDSVRLASFQDKLASRLRAIPGVREVGLTSAVPFRGVDFTGAFDRPGNPQSVSAAMRFVDSSYFDVMRIRLVRGRLFGPADGPSRPPVVVISESFARSSFGDDDPIGRTIDSETPKEVIGIVRDVRYSGFDQDPRPAVYLARSQKPSGAHLRRCSNRPAVRFSRQERSEGRTRPRPHDPHHECDDDGPHRGALDLGSAILHGCDTRLRGDRAHSYHHRTCHDRLSDGAQPPPRARDPCGDRCRQGAPRSARCA